jgi:nucleoid-associated protein YgaU
VMAIDAATGREGTYSLSSFQTSWKVLGRMAVIMDTTEEAVSPTDDADNAEPPPQIPGVIQYPTLGAPTQIPDAPVVLPLESQNPAIIPPVETPDPTMSMPVQTPEPTSITQGQAGSEETPRIYIVRRGDYLTGIARRFGVNWRNLARVNHLTAPYILYTGQKLHIP